MIAFFTGERKRDLGLPFAKNRGIIAKNESSEGQTMARENAAKRIEEREAGIDLFRCLGLLFVNGLHACLYNGFYSEPQVGAAMWAANCYRWLFSGCNGMFMLLTGYLKTAKPLGKGYYKGIITVLVGYALTCVISYPLRYYFLGEKDAWQVWVERFFTFSNYAWYVEMYIGLILISPILNMAMEHMTERKQLYWLAGTMLTLTAFPYLTSLPVLPDYWTSLYPITYYVLGAVIRRLDLKLPSWVGLLGAALTVMLLGLASLISTKGGKFNDGFIQGGNGGLLTTVMVTFLFLGVYRIRLGKRLQKVLAWMAGGVFEGYILSRLLDVWVYGEVKFWHSPEKYILIFLCVTVPVFLVSVTAGRLTHGIAVWLTGGRKKKK